jgi:hypothetical protein
MAHDSPFHRPAASRPISRRDFLWQSGGGLGGLALAAMLGQDRALAADAPGPASRPLHHPAKAKRVVQFFMAGAASHIDLFDYKPELIKRHGQPSDFGEPVEAFQNGLGPWLRPVWDFRPYGQSGKMLSEVVAPLGGVVDDLAFVHNMVGKSGVHSAATLLQSTGFQLPGFPGAGCWASYGLGSLNENLPTFVVLPDHRGFASNGVKNWDAAFLPSQHSGTIIFPGAEAPVADLFPHASGKFITPNGESAGHRLMADLNRQHAATREGDQRLDARIRSYELAARMQLAAPEALNLKAEPAHVLKLYGLDGGPQAWPKEISADEEAFHFSQKCLAARRLLERGVRFVQIWSGNDNSFPRRNWDSHEDVQRDHGPLALGMARGATAFHSRPQATGPARGHVDFMDDRVWPDAFVPRRQRARPQSVCVYELALRGRHQGRRDARRERPLGLQAPRPRKPDHGLRYPRDDSPPTRARPYAADLPAQRHRSTPHRCPRPRDRATDCLIAPSPAKRVWRFFVGFWSS